MAAFLKYGFYPNAPDNLINIRLLPVFCFAFRCRFLGDNAGWHVQDSFFDLKSEGCWIFREER